MADAPPPLPRLIPRRDEASKREGHRPRPSSSIGGTRSIRHNGDDDLASACLRSYSSSPHLTSIGGQIERTEMPDCSVVKEGSQPWRWRARVRVLLLFSSPWRSVAADPTRTRDFRFGLMPTDQTLLPPAAPATPTISSREERSYATYVRTWYADTDTVIQITASLCARDPVPERTPLPEGSSWDAAVHCHHLPSMSSPAPRSPSSPRSVRRPSGCRSTHR